MLPFQREKVTSFLVGVCILLCPTTALISQSLPRHDPALHGVDKEALSSALRKFSELEGAEAMVVVRDGAIIGECFCDGSPDTLRYQWSVTKSVTALAVGLAIEAGNIEGTSATLGETLPHRYVPSDPIKRSITIAHLLTMSSGPEWNEREDVETWFFEDDPVAAVLARPMVHEPGTYFSYSTGACHLLSAVIQANTGMDLSDFVSIHLFAPMGIRRFDWDRDPQGRSFGGHGLWLSTEDLAKLGWMMISGGTYNGVRVVPQRWVDSCSQVQFFLGDDFGPLHWLSYGYLRWVDLSAAYRRFLAWGWAGQVLFCVPDLNLVVAANSNPWLYSWEEASEAEERILNVIVSDVLPAVRGESYRPLPKLPRGRVAKPR